MRQSQPLYPRRAPFLPLKRLRKLMRHLWHHDSSKKAGLKNKAAAVALIFNWRDRCRPIDTLHMRWEDLSFVKDKTGQFITYGLRNSKGNYTGKRHELVEILKLKINYVDTNSMLKKGG